MEVAKCLTETSGTFASFFFICSKIWLDDSKSNLEVKVR